MNKSFTGRLLNAGIYGGGRSGLAFLTVIYLSINLPIIEFGTYSFLLAIALAFRQFYDLSISAAFFTFLAGRSEKERYLMPYILFLLLQLVAVLLLVIFSHFFNVLKIIFGGENVIIVIVAMTSLFLVQHIWTNITQIYECFEKTKIITQCGFFIQAAVTFIIILLDIFDSLNLLNLYLVMMIIWGVSSIYMLLLVSTDTHIWRYKVSDIPWNYIVIYIKPLIVISILSFIHDYYQRAYLLWQGGFLANANFGVALTLASIPVFFIVPVSRVFWQQIAVLHLKVDGEYEQQNQLFIRAISTCLVVTILIAACLYQIYDIVIENIYSKYDPQDMRDLKILLIYPILQVVFQLQGTYLMAVSATKLFQKINTLAIGCGLILITLLLNEDFLHLFGVTVSFGLSIKYLLIGLSQVLLSAIYLKKLYNLNISYLFDGMKILVLSVSFAHLFGFAMDIADLANWVHEVLIVASAYSLLLVLAVRKRNAG